jgi:hypothetical protein
MGAAEQAAKLREQADALEAEAELAAELADAKDAYRTNTDDPDAKQRFAEARDALTEARSARRGPTLTIGGDAVASQPEEG